jgi:hypothetical protein
MTTEVLKRSEDDAKYHVHKSGALYAVDPAETQFGYLYFAHMVPPVKPEHSLILGYGHGTVADLMRKIWGSDLKITGVDLLGYQKVGAWNEYRMEVMDAKLYIKKCTDHVIKTRFDYIAIDLWDGTRVPEFVFDVEFAVRLREMAKRYVCINVPTKDVARLKGFYDYGFKYDRVVPIEGNSIVWWSVPEEGK